MVGKMESQSDHDSKDRKRRLQILDFRRSGAAADREPARPADVGRGRRQGTLRVQRREEEEEEKEEEQKKCRHCS